MESIYNKLSKERKELQQSGEIPVWFTTAGWQMFKSKYLYNAKTPKEQYQRIAKTAAKHLNTKPDWLEGSWEEAFFEILWKGWLSPSTPVLGNMGTDRGLPVSCSGQYIEDSIHSIYESRLETAILTKAGFGTAGCMNIRPRGADISVGGKALGVVPVIDSFVRDMQYVSQTNRRGAFASYIDIEHDDFEEIVKYVDTTPDDVNIGWIVKQSFMDKLNSGDKEAIHRYQEALALKMVTGKGYFFFKDKVNDKRPQIYKDKELYVETTQLCSEILLHNSPELTFTCVLSSMNAAKYDEWKDTKAVFVATVFLDCVAQEFIEKAKQMKGLEKAISFTEKSRALGLGCAGFHTYLQDHGIPFTYEAAKEFNSEFFSKLDKESKDASQWMAEALGEPEWCKGYGVRNTHLLAIAPTKSTALIMGGISEGINPDPAMSFTQTTVAGEMDRINPVLLNLMKSRGVYNKYTIQEIVDARGSVQDVQWLLDEEKEVFKTAFEIDQRDIIKLAAQRQEFIDQGQSLNLFFDHNATEKYISYIHKMAFEDPNILTLYYCYSKRGISASKGECQSCQ